MKVIDDEKKPPISPKPVNTNVTARKNSDAWKTNFYQLLSERLEEQEALIQKFIADAVIKDAKILSLEKRLLKVEADQVKTDSLMYIKDNVTDLLSKRINQLEQYTRRYSVVVKGIPYERNEKYDSLKEQITKIIEQANCETSIDDVDKFHRNGPRDGTSQDVIIRFKSHSAKEDLYNKRKTIKLERIKIQPSLSPETKRLLGAANDLVGTYTGKHDTSDARVSYKNCPDFVFSDIHGNLLVKMSQRTENGMFFRFDSLVNLQTIIQNNNRCESDEILDRIMTEEGDDDDEEEEEKELITVVDLAVMS